jgi:acetyltransferase-like isoleucine patch superfamily enzyme
MTAKQGATRPRQSLLRRGLTDPIKGLRVGRALLRGHLFRILCRIRGVRFRAGRNFRLHGRLMVCKPGEVILGDDVVVHGLTTPLTYAPDARIIVGDNVAMESVRFGCTKEISIGRDCMMAQCSIMDTDFHSTRADRRTSEAAPVRVAPVRLGQNVWVAMNVGILAGVTIGDNSVVGYGAVCVKSFPADVVVGGNPAKVIAPILPMEEGEGRKDSAARAAAATPPGAEGTA